jgi:hypothetical protein
MRETKSFTEFYYILSRVQNHRVSLNKNHIKTTDFSLFFSQEIYNEIMGLFKMTFISTNIVSKFKNYFRWENRLKWVQWLPQLKDTWPTVFPHFLVTQSFFVVWNSRQSLGFDDYFCYFCFAIKNDFSIIFSEQYYIELIFFLNWNNILKFTFIKSYQDFYHPTKK